MRLEEERREEVGSHRFVVAAICYLARFVERAWSRAGVFVALVRWRCVTRLRVRLQSTYAARFQPFTRVATQVLLYLACHCASTNGDTAQDVGDLGPCS